MVKLAEKSPVLKEYCDVERLKKLLESTKGNLVVFEE